MAAPDPLAGLRDLHVPPPALPPWAGVAGALAVLALAAVAGLVVMLLRRRRRVRRAALAALAEAEALPPDRRLLAQAVLLRRLARTLAGPAAARERGAAWLARLDALTGSRFFTAGAGRVFGDALYQPAPPDPAALDAELARLLRGLRR